MELGLPCVTQRSRHTTSPGSGEAIADNCSQTHAGSPDLGAEAAPSVTRHLLSSSPVFVRLAYQQPRCQLRKIRLTMLDAAD